MIINKPWEKHIIYAGLILLVGIVYKFYFQIYTAYFPKCPFLLLTGYECPGCGSQRVIHCILDLNIKGAFKENPLLVLSIPYFIFTFSTRAIKNPGSRLLVLKNFLFGKKAIYIILVVILIFWLLRNIFPEDI
jgi:hypothetical protein